MRPQTQPLAEESVVLATRAWRRDSRLCTDVYPSTASELTQWCQRLSAAQDTPCSVACSMLMVSVLPVHRVIQWLSRGCSPRHQLVLGLYPHSVLVASVPRYWRRMHLERGGLLLCVVCEEVPCRSTSLPSSTLVYRSTIYWLIVYWLVECKLYQRR